MWRLPPMQQVWSGSQKVINKNIEFRQLIHDARQRSRTPAQEEFGHATLLYSCQLGTALLSPTQDSMLLVNSSGQPQSIDSTYLQPGGRHRKSMIRRIYQQ